jgi:two-component system alkaline phosphatase synthesis response regulator PhoP
MMNSNKILSVNLPREMVDELNGLLISEEILSYTSFGFSESMKMARLIIPNVFIIAESSAEEKPGLGLISVLRRNSVFNHSFIVYLTEQKDEESLMEAFRAGAEDILSIQISLRVLAGHILSLIKRLKRVGSPVALEGDMMIDPETLTVILKGKTIPMVKKEFELLQLLCSAPNRIFFRKEIVDHLWKGSILKNDRTLDVHIRKIRKKLGITNIKTVNGLGYKYEWNPA